MIPKTRLADFLRTVNTTKSPLYTWVHEGDIRSAEKYVHGMRVQLANMRRVLRQRNQAIRQFKIRTRELVELKDDSTRVTLEYQHDTTFVMTHALNDLAELIAQETHIARPTPIKREGPIHVKLS